MIERSGVLFIALREGCFGPNPTKQLQRFSLNRCNGSFQPQKPPNCRDGLQTAVSLGGSDPDSGAGPFRITNTRETQFKKNQAGREPEPGPGPEPEPGPGLAGRPAAAASGDARAWFPPNRARKLQVPKGHALCSQFSLFKHCELPSHGQCETKYF